MPVNDASPRPRASVMIVVGAVAMIIAAGSIIIYTILISSVISPHLVHDRQQHDDQEQRRQRQLDYNNGFNYVELRPPVINGSAVANAEGVAVVETTRPIDDIPPYDVDNALAALRAFRRTLFFLVYDQSTDNFVVVHGSPGCDGGCGRVYRIASFVALALRTNFHRRFQGGESIVFSDKNGVTKRGDFVVLLSTADVPRVHARCFSEEGTGNHCGSKDFAPILNFGSSFVDERILPGNVAMPCPVRPHAPCFDEWQAQPATGVGGEDREVCKDLRPRTDFSSDGDKVGLVFGRELGMMTDDDGGKGGDYWDKLIPQLIWRGTDFSFLRSMFPSMRTPSYDTDIAPHEEELRSISDDYEKKRWATRTLWKEMGGEQQHDNEKKLSPRWRGVLLTSEAELEAETRNAARTLFETGGGDVKRNVLPPRWRGVLVSSEGKLEAGRMLRERDDNGNVDPILPWANIKFANINRGGVKVPAAENEEYHKLQELGIAAVGEYMKLTEHAPYKYHIDLGGGGGTTWTGTIEKLALPGLLFHHVTPTKDWFHDLLVPWMHYVPVKIDLSDLRDKFEWAESHPNEAKKIAEAGTEFARWMGSPEGFSKLYEDRVVAPLGRVLRAYRPMPETYAGRSVLDVVLHESGGKKRRGMTVVGRCSGLHMNSCEKLF